MSTTHTGRLVYHPLLRLASSCSAASGTPRRRSHLVSQAGEGSRRWESPAWGRVGGMGEIDPHLPRKRELDCAAVSRGLSCFGGTLESGLVGKLAYQVGHLYEFSRLVQKGAGAMRAGLLLVFRKSKIGE